MDPISNVSQLAEILRKQLVDSQGKAGISAKVKERPKAASASASGPQSLEELQGKIREKLRRIDEHDPKAGQKSIHVFLESILIWEFGEKLMDDPKFYTLLDEVQLSMESDPGVRENLVSLMELMR